MTRAQLRSGPGLLRRSAKRAWLEAPFKRQLLTSLRRVWCPPKRVRHYLYFDGPFDVEVLDRRFQMKNSSFDVENSVFWTGLLGGWEKRSLRVWIELCRRSNVILDIGANTGLYALVAQTINPDAMVHGFEPVARVCERFRTNVALNGYPIRCHEVALSNYDGRGVLYDLPVDHVYVVTINQNVNPGWKVTPTDVAACRLSTFIEQERLAGVDLIKMDVESHEPEVLEGMGRYLAQMRPTFIVEVWNDEVGRRLESRFLDLGYCFFRTDEDAEFSRVRGIGNPQPERGYVDYLICTEEVAAWLSARIDTFPAP